MQQDIHFPVYVKYKNNKSYFKIISDTEFEQLQVIGSKYILSKTIATQFPEKLFINDLLNNTFGNIVLSNEQEYENLK